MEGLERGFAPLLLTLPPSLSKGRGQGDRLLNNLNKELVSTVSLAYLKRLDF